MLTDEECKAIEKASVERVRNALKVITSAEIYDSKGYLNEKGYKALEEIEGLDLFWICDPMIKLVKESEEKCCGICYLCDDNCNTKESEATNEANNRD